MKKDQKRLIAPIDEVTIIKLAAIAVHADELLDNIRVDKNTAGYFDATSIRGLLADNQVNAFLKDPVNAVYLPLKRK